MKKTAQRYCGRLFKQVGTHCWIKTKSLLKNRKVNFIFFEEILLKSNFWRGKITKLYNFFLKMYYLLFFFRLDYGGELKWIYYHLKYKKNVFLSLNLLSSTSSLSLSFADFVDAIWLCYRECDIYSLIDNVVIYGLKSITYSYWYCSLLVGRFNLDLVLSNYSRSSRGDKFISPLPYFWLQIQTNALCYNMRISFTKIIESIFTYETYK